MQTATRMREIVGSSHRPRTLALMVYASSGAESAARLLLDPSTRLAVWDRVTQAIERHLERDEDLPVDPRPDPEAVRAVVRAFDFDAPIDPIEALDWVIDGLSRFQPHQRHGRHFGLFEPAAATMGIAGDALAAAFNPCLATWASSPFGVEVEQHLVRVFGTRFGYDPEAVGGTLTTGASEANLNAVLMALAQRLPELRQRGLRAVSGQPVCYTTAQAHPSVARAAWLSGLGTDAVREVDVDGSLRMDVGALRRAIERDRVGGAIPFLVAVTAGTTGTGVIDPLAEVADVAAEANLWLHVDAAWGGAVALVDRLRPLMTGIERADSIAFDPHKWLSVPMGAGLSLTRHREALRQAFDVRPSFMVGGEDGEVDPHAVSMQWSRRFAGLKVLLILAVAGWEGYATILTEQVELGARLRDGLRDDGWRIVNDTPLPLVCFVDGGDPGRPPADVERVVEEVNATGAARIHVARLAPDRVAARACVTSYQTQAADVDALVDALAWARRRALASSPGQGAR